MVLTKYLKFTNTQYMGTVKSSQNDTFGLGILTRNIWGILKDEEESL